MHFNFKNGASNKKFLKKYFIVKANTFAVLNKQQAKSEIAGINGQGRKASPPVNEIVAMVSCVFCFFLFLSG